MCIRDSLDGVQQRFRCRAPSAGVMAGGNGRAKGAVQRVAVGQRRGALLRDGVGAGVPVSYTHLDVYKRQVGTSGTSYTDGVQPEQSYTYTVKAHRNGFFSNAGSASVTTPDCSVPPPAPPVLVSPSNNAKIVEGESIVLTWNSVTNATGYFGNITGGPAPLTFGWQTGISKNIGSQSPGYEYLWEVKARNGSVEGNFSNKWVFIVIPKAPSNLSASLQSCSSVNLTWTDNSGSEDGYKIYRNGTEVGLVGAGGSSYTDQGLQEQTSYSYVVRAHRNGLHSNPSNSASITTPSCNGDTTAPQVVWVEPVGDTESYNVSGETVTLKVNATDNVAVDYVIFSRWDHPTQQLSLIHI